MIDTHVHLWKPNQLSYPWLEDEPTLNQDYLLSDLGKESEGTIEDGFIFVQAGTSEEDFLKEAQWISSLAELSAPKILGIVAGASIESGTNVLADLKNLADLGLVKGVRRLIQGEPDDNFCSRPEFIDGLQCLPRFGLSFDICIYHRQLPSVLKMVEQCPEVHFILDHLGKPGVKLGVMDPWKEQIRELSSFKNVDCKISGLITEADHKNWKRSALDPYIEHVLECFGPSRVMYGSDWPVINLAGGYVLWLEILRNIIPQADHAAFFHDNARRIYRLGAAS